MKYFILIILITANFQLHASDKQGNDPEVLVGEWILDMTPENQSDDNFAMMRIEEINGKSLSGVFYREGVKIRQGRINTETAFIYGALISGDNSGEYNSSFYLKDGLLHGTTHAVDRGFLSVWSAHKSK